MFSRQPEALPVDVSARRGSPLPPTGYRPADGMCERRHHEPGTRGHHRRHQRNRLRRNTTERAFGQPRCQSDRRRRQVGRDRALVPEQQLEHAVVVFQQRVAVGDLGDLQRHTAGRQIELGEERRRQCQRMHRRADVVGHVGVFRVRGGGAPPNVGKASNTCTARPARAQMPAAARPLVPLPTTVTSTP